MLPRRKGAHTMHSRMAEQFSSSVLCGEKPGISSAETVSPARRCFEVAYRRGICACSRKRKREGSGLPAVAKRRTPWATQRKARDASSAKARRG